MIYAIQAGENGPIKVGRSVNVPRRRDNLQMGHYEPLYVRYVMAGDEAVEADLHLFLADTRLQGEWFADSPELRTLFDDAPSPSAALMLAYHRMGLAAFAFQHRLWAEGITALKFAARLLSAVHLRALDK